jgi:eukaryotic-like serine/threonine-protein kinase
VNEIPEKIGRYRILERVGTGGMGVLYRGVDTVLDREVAIKLMLTEVAAEGDQMRARFSREARAIAKLQHRNIVTVFELAEENGTQYIVMELLRGTSLAARMAAPPPLTLDDKLDIVTQLCAGLGYAHARGIVHRDVKPANIFLLTDGTVKLLDFGLAKTVDSNLTRLGDTLGSVHYMSPEQVVGSDSIDARADVFSTGAMLYEMLAGRKPFEAPTPTATLMKILDDDPAPLQTLAPQLPGAIVAVVNRALAKNPALRFDSAADLERELQRIRRGPTNEATIVADPIATPRPDPARASGAEPTLSAGPRIDETLIVEADRPAPADVTIAASVAGASSPTIDPASRAPVAAADLAPTMPPPRVAEPPTLVRPTVAPPAVAPVAMPPPAVAAVARRAPVRWSAWLLLAIVGGLVLVGGALIVATRGRGAASAAVTKTDAPAAPQPSPPAAPPPAVTSVPAAAPVAAPVVTITPPPAIDPAAGSRTARGAPDKPAPEPPKRDAGARLGPQPARTGADPKCAKLLERASLGEALTTSDLAFLNQNCRD